MTDGAGAVRFPSGAATRRHFLQLAAAGAFVRAFDPERRGWAAGAQGVPVLADGEATTLAAFGDALVPGAAKARLVEFVEAMLAGPVDLLCYEVLGPTLPPRDFYKAALAAIDDASRRRGGRSFGGLPKPEQEALIDALLGARPEGWSGPPPGLVYFVLRNDALDVVYGGPDAYDRLGVPYLAHIEPPRPW